MERGFHDEGIMFRIVGDSIAVTPPLIVSESQIGEIFDKVGKVIKALTSDRPAHHRARPQHRPAELHGAGAVRIGSVNGGCISASSAMAR